MSRELSHATWLKSFISKPETQNLHFPDLSTKRFLLSRSGPAILLIHCRSSATWETKWSMWWRFQRWFQIHSFSAFWRASGPSIACLTMSQFHGGGVGVIVLMSNSSVLF